MNVFQWLRMQRYAGLFRSVLSIAVAAALALPGTAAATPWALQTAVPAGARPPAGPATVAVPPGTIGPANVVPPATSAAPVQAVVVVPAPHPDPEPGKGTGYVVGGVFMLVVAAALLGGGVATISRYRRGRGPNDLPEIDTGEARVGGALLVVLAIGPAVGGVALSILAARQQRVWQAWRLRQALARRISPSFARTRHGTWTAGVRLEF